MKIFKIHIDNYRLLIDFSMDLEKELSLLIGKNNTGKTSILFALDKFLSQTDKSKFTFDDFNIEFKKELKKLIEDYVATVRFKHSFCSCKGTILYSVTLSNKVLINLAALNLCLLLTFILF